MVIASTASLETTGIEILTVSSVLRPCLRIRSIFGWTWS